MDKLGTDFSLGEIFHSFFMGWRFDTVVSCYLLFIPCFILTVFYFLNSYPKIVQKLLFFIVWISFSITFLVAAADIPYFHQFFSRFSVSAFDWADSPMFVAKMILEEPSYWLYIIPFILLVYIFYKCLKKVFKGGLLSETKPNYKIEIPLSLVFLFLLFIGMRGRISKKSPIRVGTAFFGTNAMLNKLGLNPNFTLLRSYLDRQEGANQKIHLMKGEKAIHLVQDQLGIKNPQKNNPLLRNIAGDSVGGKKMNVVLIIMESMSIGKMQRGGNKHNLTPFLDSLSHEGYFFTNAYSAGIHTFNGIFSTLFSFPAIFRRHSMKHTPIPSYNGLSYTLKKQGYSTTFFIPHDGQFDNVEGFLMANNFDKVYSKKDYPPEKIKTALGVPDDFMFRFSIPIINKLNKKKKPFLVTFMTASDHGPWYVPDYFRPNTTDKKNRATEYADYSLKVFMQLARKQAWFKNTLFVFIADHGAAIDATYDISLDYNHVPLLFYAPNIIEHPKDLNQMVGQIDVFPTIMGVLGLPYKNNTLGINAFAKKRPYIYFGVDNKFGVIDHNWLYIFRDNNRSGLYKYKQKDKTNYISSHQKRAKKMKEYGISNIQSYQYVLNHHLTKIKAKNGGEGE